MRTLSLSSVVVVVALGVLSAAASCPNPQVITNDPRPGRPDDEDPDGSCDVDGDCNGGEVCDDGSCVRVCSEDADCAGGQLCQSARCVTPECIDDVDCPGGFFCDANVCTGISSCDEGNARCIDGDTAAVCVSGHEVLDECSSGFACDGGSCVFVGEGEGEVVAEGEGDVIAEGEGEGEAACVDACIDDVTEHVCAFGIGFDQECAANAHCVVDRCVADDVCVPACGNRVCGTDPVCGESCGSCADTCTADGRCIVETPVGTARIQVSISPANDGFNIYLSRKTSGSFCDVDDSCFFNNCEATNELRPDWDNNRNSTDGDPVAAFDNSETVTVLTPTTAQTYRVAVHRVGTGAATVTLNIIVDGVNLFGASKRLNEGELWTGTQARWNGSNVTVTRTDAIEANFSCGGEACTSGGTECAAGFVCDVGGNFLQQTAVCAECIDSADCSAGEECRSDYCIPDGADRGIGGVCSRNVDCRDDLACSGAGTCAETCSVLFCTIGGGADCCLSGGTCGFDGFCG